MRSNATTVDDYLAELDDERREALEDVRETILENLPDGIVESMNWGKIAYEVPLETYPATYNGQPLMFAALASQKRHMAVYLSAITADPELDRWFREAYRATGMKMDVGKSCVRFRSLEHLPLDLIGEAIGKVTLEDFIALYGR